MVSILTVGKEGNKSVSQTITQNIPLKIVITIVKYQIKSNHRKNIKHNYLDCCHCIHQIAHLLGNIL